MVRVAAHVGVKQADAETAGPGAGHREAAKQRRQILAHLPPGVAVSVDRGPFRRIGEHRLARHLRPEAHAARRQGQPRLPAVQRVVVAVADEGAYARRRQPLQPSHELQLRPQAAVGSVVDVAGHQQRVHPFPQAQPDDVVIGVESGAAQRIRDVIRRFASNTAKGAVQVQVRRRVRISGGP